MYCINCGVKLEDTESRCPLCGVTVYHPELTRQPAEPLYPRHRYPAPEAASKVAHIVVSTLMAIALLTRLFLLSQPGILAFMASGMISVAAACSAVMRLCGKGFTLKGAASRLPRMMLVVSAMMLLALIFIGALQGIAVLLPMAFALLVGAAVFLLIALENKILR